MQSHELNAAEKQIADDLHWALQAPEVLQHAGKIVAIHKKRVIGVGTDRNSLVPQAAEKAQCSWQDLVILVVPAADLTELPR
jgi:hypothetical protein